MSQGDEESGNAPTIVTATAVNVDKGYAGGPGQPGHGGNSGVPVVVAQPWSVQGQYGQMLGHPEHGSSMWLFSSKLYRMDVMWSHLPH